jgi:hypothetical protein
MTVSLKTNKIINLLIINYILNNNINIIMNSYRFREAKMSVTIIF